MSYSKSDIVKLCTVNFEPTAHVIKSHLESEGIPAYLQTETYGRLYGHIAGGLGGVSIMVLREHAEQAARIISSQNFEQEQAEVDYEEAYEYEDEIDGEGKNKNILSKLASFLWGIVIFSRGGV